MKLKDFAKKIGRKAVKELSPAAFDKRKKEAYERKKQNLKYLKVDAQEAKLRATIANAEIKRKKKSRFGTGSQPEDPTKLDWKQGKW